MSLLWTLPASTKEMGESPNFSRMRASKLRKGREMESNLAGMRKHFARNKMKREKRTHWVRSHTCQQTWSKK